MGKYVIIPTILETDHQQKHCLDNQVLTSGAENGVLSITSLLCGGDGAERHKETNQKAQMSPTKSTCEHKETYPAILDRGPRGARRWRSLGGTDCITLISSLVLRAELYSHQARLGSWDATDHYQGQGPSENGAVPFH